MENKPLVTIITDTKNRKQLISRCIESIQQQTYQNYEHIIADGGNDDTEEIVKRYNDPHIKYIKVPEGGPVAQTKKAFEISKGEYITFLDDDDAYLPEKIEKQLEYIRTLSDEYGFIYGTMSYYDNATQRYLYDHKADIEGGIEILPIIIAKPVVCGTPTFMFRRKVFEDIGGTWISGIGNEMSDWALGCKAIKLGWKVGALKTNYLKIYVNHGHVRMSNSGFYKDNAARYILFHNYFLTEYASVIKRYPKAAIGHYNGLIINYLYIGSLKEAYNSWRNLLKSDFSIRNLLIFPYRLLKVSLVKLRN